MPRRPLGASVHRGHSKRETRCRPIICDRSTGPLSSERSIGSNSGASVQITSGSIHGAVVVDSAVTQVATALNVVPPRFGRLRGSVMYHVLCLCAGRMCLL